MRTKSHLSDYRPPTGRRASASLVERLREIDRDAELIYVGKGKWILGVVQPDDRRQRMAERMIDALETVLEAHTWGLINLPEDFKRQVALRLWKYRLYRQGFRNIAIYTIQGEPDARIVEDFRRRDWVWRHSFREHLHQVEKEASGEADFERKVARLMDYLELEGEDIHRHAFRHPHSVSGRTTRARSAS